VNEGIIANPLTFARRFLFTSYLLMFETPLKEAECFRVYLRFES
jgi:hypothetical protein